VLHFFETKVLHFFETKFTCNFAVLFFCESDEKGDKPAIFADMSPS